MAGWGWEGGARRRSQTVRASQNLGARQGGTGALTSDLEPGPGSNWGVRGAGGIPLTCPATLKLPVWASELPRATLTSGGLPPDHHAPLPPAPPCPVPHRLIHPSKSASRFSFSREPAPPRPLPLPSPSLPSSTLSPRPCPAPHSPLLYPLIHPSPALAPAGALLITSDQDRPSDSDPRMFVEFPPRKAGVPEGPDSWAPCPAPFHRGESSWQ